MDTDEANPGAVDLFGDDELDGASDEFEGEEAQTEEKNARRRLGDWPQRPKQPIEIMIL